MNNFVVYDKDSKRIVTAHPTMGGAKTSRTNALKRIVKRNAKREAYRLMHSFKHSQQDPLPNLEAATLEFYNANIRCTVTVKNLMSGEDVVQDVNTPLCCDPSSETYWSM